MEDLTPRNERTGRRRRAPEPRLMVDSGVSTVNGVAVAKNGKEVE